jgi:hypothetical protein
MDFWFAVGIVGLIVIGDVGGLYLIGGTEARGPIRVVVGLRILLRELEQRFVSAVDRFVARYGKPR